MYMVFTSCEKGLQGMKIELTFMDKLVALDHLFKREGLTLEGALKMGRASVCSWMHGRTFPSQATAVALEELTEGFITRDDVTHGRAVAAQARGEKAARNMFTSDAKLVEAATTPIARKAEILRQRAEFEGIPIHERWGVSRMTAYNWLTGKSKPQDGQAAHLISLSWDIVTPEDFLKPVKLQSKEKRARGRPRNVNAFAVAPQTPQVSPSAALPSDDFLDIFG
jgi:hypothetical protein